MPDLPTITVTTAQATKALAAFGDVAGYKAWLRQAVQTEVKTRMWVQHQQAEEEARLERQAQYESELETLGGDNWLQ